MPVGRRQPDVERALRAAAPGFAAVTSPAGALLDTAVAHREARAALAVVERGLGSGPPRRRAIRPAGAGAARGAGPPAGCRRPELAPLRDAPRGGALVATLEAYLAERENVRAAGRRLGIAPRTVAYRLERIKRLGRGPARRPAPAPACRRPVRPGPARGTQAPWRVALSDGFGKAPAVTIDVRALWDFDDPAASEARFREARPPRPATTRWSSRPRSRGQRPPPRPGRGRELLDGVRARLDGAGPEPRVRYELELGRAWISAVTLPEERTPDVLAAARETYGRAFELARDAGLDDLAIDAVHMMAIVEARPADQIAWIDKAWRSRPPRACPLPGAGRRPCATTAGWRSTRRAATRTPSPTSARRSPCARRWRATRGRPRRVVDGGLGAPAPGPARRGACDPAPSRARVRRGGRAGPLRHRGARAPVQGAG